jgi:MtaA/CmuA family methyltransferase
MNGLQRYNAMLAGEPVDFVPRIPILMQFAAEYIGASYGDFCSKHAVKTEANLRCAEDFGLDVVGVMSDPYSETQGFGGEIIFHDRATPECVRPPLADSADLDALPRPDPRTAPRMANTLANLRDYVERAAGQYTILGWVEGPIAEAGDLRGIQQILMDLYDDPAWVGELMDRCVDVAIDFARAQIEAGADTIGIGDALASQMSAAMYAEHVQPREIRLAEAIAAAGARVRMHICGNITHLLPALADVPIDVLDVDHMVDLSLVRKTMPVHVAIGCNIDPVSGVLKGTPDSIRRMVAEKYQQVGNPFLVNAGCEIPPGTPHENLRALCDPLAYRA